MVKQKQMQIMKKYERIMTVLLSIIILELATYLILRFHKNIDFQNFAINFNSFLTPIITAIALIIYYLSLMQMKKQTKSIIEEKEILHSENIYKDYIIKIQELKESASKKDLSKSFPKGFKKIPFTVLTIYTGLISELVIKLKTNTDYKNFLQKDINEKIDEKEVFNFSMNEYYISLYTIFYDLSSFVYKVNFILIQIIENQNIHKSHSDLLIKYIAKEILCNYFLFVINKELFNYDLINSGRVNQNQNRKPVFESLDIDMVYDFYKDRYPEIIEEVLFFQSQ